MSVTWKKKYGQHLLHDKNILRKIVASIDLKEGDYVLEIGCGSGALTEFLVQKSIDLKAVEIDEQFFGMLLEKFGHYDNFNLVKGDILKTDLSTLLPDGRKTIIVGNLPYNITSQILFRFFEHKNAVSKMVFLIQKEVAQRITGKPRTKDYGILSVISQFYADTKILFPVKKNSFFPVPAVDSAVIELKVKTDDHEIDVRKFFEVVKTAFAKRRKTMRNNLSVLDGVDLEVLQRTFDLNERPEDFSVAQYTALTKSISLQQGE